MNENEVIKGLANRVSAIAKLEKELVEAETVMRRLELKLNDQGVTVVLGGVHHSVTTIRYGQYGGVSSEVSPGASDLHALCLKLQRSHIISLKSRIEGQRFKLKKEVAQV